MEGSVSDKEMQAVVQMKSTQLLENATYHWKKWLETAMKIEQLYR